MDDELTQQILEGRQPDGETEHGDKIYLYDDTPEPSEETSTEMHETHNPSADGEINARPEPSEPEPDDEAKRRRGIVAAGGHPDWKPPSDRPELPDDVEPLDMWALWPAPTHAQVTRAQEIVDGYVHCLQAAEERVEELEGKLKREREALRRRNETMFTEGEVEIRYAHDPTGGRDEDDDRPVDEVVGRGVCVHLEYLGGQWFLQVGDKHLHLTDEATRTADERVDWLDDQLHDERQRRQEAELRVDELQDGLAMQHGDSRDYWKSLYIGEVNHHEETREELREARELLRLWLTVDPRDNDVDMPVIQHSRTFLDDRSDDDVG